MDETSTAFALPHARASATHCGPLLDRISVRDYVRAADIGAFNSEHGVEQRLRFNIVLEVVHHAGADHDDVDRVISYDTITEAVDAALDAERVDLLETLAERVAQACLRDPRSVRVFVRIEKLDRIPGSLGVEIVRNRVPAEQLRIRPLEEPVVDRNSEPPIVVFLAPDAAFGPVGRMWRDTLLALCRPVIVCLAPLVPPAGPSRTTGARRIGLLSIEQAAWALADADPRFEVIGSRTELDHTLRSGRHPIWAPTRMVVSAGTDCRCDAGEPEVLAAWLAAQVGARDLVLVSTPASPEPGETIRLHRLALSDSADLAAHLAR